MSKKKVKLNVVLLKSNATLNEPEVFINNYQQNNVIDFPKGNINAILYKKIGSEKKEPDWFKDLKKKVVGNINIDLPTTQTSGATLFIQIQNRIFAINFGTQGRFNINPKFIDTSFGIYTANRLLQTNPNINIKQVDSRVNNSNPTNKQHQYGTEVSTDQLLLSMEDNEALREISIIDPSSEDFQRMIGKYNSLNVQFIFNELPCFSQLPIKLENLLDTYNSVSNDDIKKLFKGIFPLREDESNGLNSNLPNKITTETDNFFLFEPEINFDYSQVANYKIIYSEGEEKFEEEIEELKLNTYLNIKPDPNYEDLTNDRIEVIDEDGETIKSWSIFDCIYGEVEDNNTNYILSNGQWFEVTKEKYESVNSAIEEVIDDDFTIPESILNNVKSEIENIKTHNPGLKINKENIFNTHFSDHLHGELFDEASKQIKIIDDKIEVCDVLKENIFFHVKYNYNASALSHLFNQGFVSAKSYACHTTDYVREVNNHVTNNTNYLTETHNTSTVHYLILNNKKTNRLTFFSKMVFEDKIRMLNAMSFKVKLSWVKNPY